ncbi:hypothetical protein MF672_025460 [Actinomadura sp. ATCC 31491]|uniref:Lipoprotein n=1 Tax=Actinomadura luzonensis TaxID=2805427 RepID=A0ABT0FXP6_9ACTN|nr:hypothetical protein [Actinomadura luzonensis]MCK2217115.1 hypothetical protein [Actinomadura luzonensis]
MQRLIAGLAGAVVLTVAAVPAAAAAPADPVKALKSRVVAGQGVKVTDVTSYVDMEGKTVFLRRTGVLQYGKAVKGGTGAVAAADLRNTYIPHEGPVFDAMGNLLGDERTITVGRYSYIKGAKLFGATQKGKSWIRLRRALPGGFNGRYSQSVNAAEPATLQVLVKHGERSGPTYKGTVGEAALWKASPWYRAATLVKPTDGTLQYELTLGANGLPQRLVTSHPAKKHWAESLVNDDIITVETRYTGWGGKVRVTAPPKNQVQTG